jgi:hypothetical protein
MEKRRKCGELMEKNLIHRDFGERNDPIWRFKWNT